MLKKILITIATIAMAAQPVVPATVQADSGTWTYIQSIAAWSYDDYKVERLDYSGNFMGPMSIGDDVVIAKSSQQCYPTTGCERYDLYSLRDGMQLFVGNVPIEAVNEQRYYANNEEFVYIDANDLENDRWNVVQVDLDNGDEEIIIEDVFIDGVTDIDVMKDGDDYYFNPSLNWNDHNGYTNAVVYHYDDPTNSAEMVTDHWQQQRDEVQDVSNGLIISKVTYDSGYKQLWIYDTTTDPVQMEAIKDTWTPENEDILGAHFRADGKIEFFDMYQRYIYDGEKTEAQGDNLSWYHSHEEALQVVNGRMAWLDPQDGLHVSGADVELDLGTIGYPTKFTLTDDALFYASDDSGKKYDFATETTTTYPFVVTDALNDAVVGEDSTGSIWYYNSVTEREINLGFGTNAVISDDMHVYWYGIDGGVYEGTLSLNAMTETSEIRAVKTVGSSRTYLVLDNEAYWIQNDSVFFSWFDSWSDTETVSSAEFNSFDYKGDAFYAPGSRLKLVGDPKVYMVGTDGKLHWITTQLIAYNIYGPSWNKGIIEITQQDLTGLSFSSSISDESEVRSI